MCQARSRDRRSQLSRHGSQEKDKDKSLLIIIFRMQGTEVRQKSLHYLVPFSYAQTAMAFRGLLQASFGTIL
jgi:hypothetical protein